MVVSSQSMVQQAGQGHVPPSTVAAEPTTFEPRQFFYPVPWRAHSYHAGATLTKHHGNGTDFAGYASLLACPDPKRIDIRASVRTQPQQWLVRTYLERAAIHVYAIVDVSSSLFFQGPSAQDLQQRLTRFVASLAWSVTRQGDGFGMHAASDHLPADLQRLPSFQPGTAQQVHGLLNGYWQQASSQGADQGHTASALPAAIEAIGSRRALVFLISDFFWPAALLQATMRAAQPHDVMPVVLRDASAFEGLPAFGWARLRDMETGQERSWLLRRKLRAQITADAAQQKQSLNQALIKAGARLPLWLPPDWRAEDVSRHLMETMA
ncbi:DUF58 domain-containing protein [Methylophilus sp. 3sh_L]|uniref:DUF58 domain-containing protein n=1 Tax=Methylophilus sp. 3sh_L TaxID=3377114 RepID=UPI00398E57E1